MTDLFAAPQESLAAFIVELASSKMEAELLNEYLRELAHLSYEKLTNEFHTQADETNIALGTRADLYISWIAPNKVSFRDRTLCISLVDGNKILLDFEGIPDGKTFWMADALFPGGGVNWKQCGPEGHVFGNTSYSSTELARLSLKRLVRCGFGIGH